MTVSVRAPRENEAGSLARLINTVSQAEFGVDDVNETELRRWFSHPEIDRERDMFLAEESGRAVAYGDVGEQGRSSEQYWVDVRLPPGAGEEAAEAVLRAAEARVRERALDGKQPRVISGAWTVNERLGRVLQRAGFKLYRHSFRMEIDLAAALQEPRFPDDVGVRPFEPSHARAIFEAADESFRDTWDHVPGDFDEWKHWMIERDDFDPSLWWIVWARDEIAGVCLCRPHETQTDMGWVSTLAVRRQWRRRGIARALLLSSFHEFRRRGYARVGLGVDADSLTGAHLLYESAGMREVRRFDLYEKVLA